MYLAQKTRNVCRGVLQLWGSNAVKRGLWNKEFAAGRWDYIDRTPDDCVYPVVAKYADGGRILDLGCGSGNTGNELAADTYERYTGVDISDTALQKARQRSEQSGRSAKNHYAQGDIVSYVPTQCYDVILFRESIFYVSRRKIAPMLRRYKNYLTDRGVFVVRMCDREKYAFILKVIESNFQVVERYAPEQTTTVIVVFR